MRIRSVIVSLLILLTAIYCFSLPKTKYQSPDILNDLEIPVDLYNWNGRDVDDFNSKDDRYNFISDILARQYVNRYRESLMFLVLDAGNFHNPKVCYGSSGYSVSEVDMEEMTFNDRSILPYGLLMEKGGHRTLLVYWLVINKKLHNWTEQKFTELWYSLIGKKKVGLMVRMEIPVGRFGIQGAKNISRRFLKDLSRQLSEEDQNYLFGRARALGEEVRR